MLSFLCPATLWRLSVISVLKQLATKHVWAGRRSLRTFILLLRSHFGAGGSTKRRRAERQPSHNKQDENLSTLSIHFRSNGGLREQICRRGGTRYRHGTQSSGCQGNKAGKGTSSGSSGGRSGVWGCGGLGGKFAVSLVRFVVFSSVRRSFRSFGGHFTDQRFNRRFATEILEDPLGRSQKHRCVYQ